MIAQPTGTILRSVDLQVLQLPEMLPSVDESLQRIQDLALRASIRRICQGQQAPLAPAYCSAFAYRLFTANHSPYNNISEEAGLEIGRLFVENHTHYKEIAKSRQPGIYAATSTLATILAEKYTVPKEPIINTAAATILLMDYANR